jgi:hypothetical protein
LTVFGERVAYNSLSSSFSFNLSFPFPFFSLFFIYFFLFFSSRYALEVEKETTAKKPNLILNVDGCIAVSFVDLLRECGSFTATEANEYINIGCLNALFVLGRTTGFIGHYIDQKRLKQVPSPF